MKLCPQCNERPAKVGYCRECKAEYSRIWKQNRKHGVKLRVIPATRDRLTPVRTLEEQRSLLGLTSWPKEEIPTGKPVYLIPKELWMYVRGGVE